MLSGGSPASVSVTCAATTVTVHVSPSVKSESGLSVQVVGPDLRLYECVPELVHEIVNEEPPALTGSSNVTVMLVAGMETEAFVGVVAVTLGGVSVVNDQTKFAAMLSGGSPASLSLTCAASTVAVQSSPLPKSLFGSTVHTVGPPLTATVCAPVLAQLIVTGLLVIVTASLNVMLRFVFVAMPVEVSVGVTAVTDGAASVVNWNEYVGPMLSGGSFVSVSETAVFRMVTVHSSFGTKSVSGLMVLTLPGFPVMTLVCEPEVAQEMPAEESVTLSFHVIWMLVFVAMPVEPSFGDVAVMNGAWSSENEKL